MSDAYRDGEEALRARLDDLAWQRVVLEGELAGVQRELAAVETSLGRREARHWRACIWFLAVPISIIGLSAWGLWRPCFTHPRAEAARVGAQAIRQAAELYTSTEDAGGCPIVERLVATKKLDRMKIDDPWGRPYLVECMGEDVHVTSAGKDGSFFTPDDIRDDFKPSDIKRVADLE